MGVSFGAIYWHMLNQMPDSLFEARQLKHTASTKNWLSLLHTLCLSPHNKNLRSVLLTTRPCTLIWNTMVHQIQWTYVTWLCNLLMSGNQHEHTCRGQKSDANRKCARAVYHWVTGGCSVTTICKLELRQNQFASWFHVTLACAHISSCFLQQFVWKSFWWFWCNVKLMGFDQKAQQVGDSCRACSF